MWVDETEVRYTNWGEARGKPNNRFPAGGLPADYLLMQVQDAPKGSWWDVPDSAIPQFHPGFVCEWEGTATVPGASNKPGDSKEESRPSDLTLIRTVSGLKYADLFQRPGAQPEPGQTCVVYYEGWLWENGRKGTKFVSAFDRGEAFEFTLGSKQAIPGLEEGVSTMRVGGRRRLLIPPELAYGAKGVPGKIPPDATLLFRNQPQ